MPNEEELKTMIDRELEILEIHLWANSMRSAITLEEYISASIAQGVSREVIKESLLLDLNTGGRIFGEFRNAIRATGEGSINRFSDNSMYSELGTDKQYRWVAILVNTCPDCEARHGQVKLWSEWEQLGLPKSGQTVCKDFCKCKLLPADSTEMQPIKREKRK